ncbi:MAG: hypothetical protein QXQ14_01580 [Candidatus Aenigmatarchaeota archaeon]
MKGISEVVAMLLMLVITIGLVGTVWYFLSGTTKRGNFQIIDVVCNAGNPATVRIVASYTGADATPGDITVRVRNKLTGTWTTASSTIYKGTNCNRDTIGAAGCNTQATATAPVTSGETVGISSSAGNIGIGTPIDVQILVFGQPSGLASVTCY